MFEASVRPWWAKRGIRTIGEQTQTHFLGEMCAPEFLLIQYLTHLLSTTSRRNDKKPLPNTRLDGLYGDVDVEKR